MTDMAPSRGARGNPLGPHETAPMRWITAWTRARRGPGHRRRADGATLGRGAHRRRSRSAPKRDAAPTILTGLALANPGRRRRARGDLAAGLRPHRADDRPTPRSATSTAWPRRSPGRPGGSPGAAPPPPPAPLGRPLDRRRRGGARGALVVLAQPPRSPGRHRPPASRPHLRATTPGVAPIRPPRSQRSHLPRPSPGAPAMRWSAAAGPRPARRRRRRPACSCANNQLTGAPRRRPSPPR